MKIVGCIILKNRIWVKYYYLILYLDINKGEKMEEINVIEKTNINFYDLERNIYKLVCELGCNILKSILENQDKKLMNSRDKKELRHKGYKNNTIKTIMRRGRI